MKSGEKKSEVSLQGPADILPLTDNFHESVSSCRGVGDIRRYGHFRQLLRYDHKYIPPTTSLIYPHHSVGATVRAFTNVRPPGFSIHRARFTGYYALC